MLLSDNHFTPVLGLDIHFTTLPPFNPFHPYIGIVVDPMDYIPFIGATVHVNGIKRGVSDTSGVIIPLVHIPLFTPPWFMAPIIGHESMNFFAAEKVLADGMRFSPKGHMLMTCNDIGIPLSIQPGKKKFWKLVPTLFAPTSYSLPIPTGSSVNVGGPYPPDWGGMIMGLAMSFGFGAIMNLGRKFFAKVLKKCKGPQWLRKALCHAGFEPVNLVNGAVVYEGTDFSLPGMIPLEWKRAWYSDSSYQGALGYGVHWNYDLDVEIIPEEEAIAVRAEDGRIVAFPLIEEEEEFYLRQEKITLKRNKNSFEIYHHDTQQIYYYTYGVTSFQYKLTKIENIAGFSLTFNYRADVVAEITDTAGRKIQIQSEGGKIIRADLLTENNEPKTLVEYSYDEVGNMAGITDSLGQTTHIKYEDHLMVKKTDRNGQSFYWEYDGSHTGSRCIHTWGDGGLQEGRIEYHPKEGYNIVTDARGSQTFYYYTPEQLVTQIKDPLGNSRFFQYTEFMEIYREIDEEGNMTGYSYDDRGNPIAITFADGSEHIFMYDERDRQTLSISPEGQKRAYIYSEETNMLHSIIEPDDSFTVLEYNEKNLPCEIRKNGVPLYMAYDAQNNLLSLTDKEGNATRWEYDYQGNVTRVENAVGNTQHFRYDELGRVISVNSPQGHTRFRYNAYEEILEAFDDKTQVSFQYTPLGSLRMREQNGIKVHFAYDAMEQLKEIRNEKEERYLFYRNARGDIRQETGFDKTSLFYHRDRAGKIIKIQKPGGSRTEYEYNLRGQVIRAEHSDGSWETFDYNKDGQLIEARNQDNCVKLNRDAAGRITEEFISSGLPEDPGHHILSTYDENGNRVEISSTLGALIRNRFDEQGNLVSLEALQEWGDGQQEAWKAEITRNHLGQEIEKELSGGLRLTTSYDEYGRPIKQQVRSGHRETYHRQYTWSPTHKLTQVLNGLTCGKTEFTYDVFGSLASAQYEDGSYDYKLPDEVGNLYKNPEKKDRIYGTGSKLLQDENWHYIYDAEGNLKLKTHRKVGLNTDLEGQATTKSTLLAEEDTPQKKVFWFGEDQFDRKAEIRNYSKAERKAYDRLRQKTKDKIMEEYSWALGDWEYQWQGNGMLKAVRTPEGKWIQFEYDALGRRTAKLAGDKIYRYLWEGNVLLHEWSYLKSERPGVITDELGLLKPDRPEPVENLTTWVYEEGSLVPTAKLEGEERYSLISDYIGRPVQAYNAKGEVVWEAEYDIYGNIRKQEGTKDINFIPFRQLGQYEDKETGLYYNRFRYYSPETGSYLSKDPIGLHGGIQLYGYVHDSNTWIDPFGLLELVYQLVNDADEVVYYGITSREAQDRLAEHLADPLKKGKFVRMEILAEGLTHDQARSIEGALIRSRLAENIDKFLATDSIKEQLNKSKLFNKNRGRVKERWTSSNPLADLKDKMLNKPKKVKCH